MSLCVYSGKTRNDIKKYIKELKKKECLATAYIISSIQELSMVKQFKKQVLPVIHVKPIFTAKQIGNKWVSLLSESYSMT